MSKSKKSSGKDSDPSRKVVARNKIARHRYEFEDYYEAGMALVGTEVKSLRNGGAALRDSYADVKSGEVFLENCHIAPYSFGNRANHDPLRSRKLLMHKREIKKLIGKIAERGYALVPVEIYFTGGKAKVKLGLGKGKKTLDRREEIKKRDMERDMERERRRYR